MERLRGTAVAGFAVAVALNVGYLALARGLADAGPPRLTQDWQPDVSEAIGSVLTTAVGLVLVWARPRNPVGWLLGLAGFLLSLQHTAAAYAAYVWVHPESGWPDGRVLLAFAAPLWIPALFIPVTFVLVRYPTGRIEGRWARRFDRAVLVGMTVLCLGYALSKEAITDDLAGGATNPLQLNPPAWLAVTLSLTAAVFAVGGLVGILGDALVRIRRSPRSERIALIWLFTWSVIATALVWFGPSEWLGSAAYFGVLVAVAVGVLRYQALGIEVAVQRTLVYAILTGLVVAVFVLVVAGLARLVPSGPTPQIVAAAVIAVGLAPARDRVQSGVDRLLYGTRSDPSSALRRLSSVEGGSAGEIAASLATALAESMRLDGVMIRDADGVVIASAGHEATSISRGLSFAGNTVGTLEVGVRPGGRSVSPELVESIAPFVAAALHSAVLADDLRLSRNRVVDATEQERARLRRELHDGLGPSLTGIGLGLEAAQRRHDPTLVARLREEVSSSLEEIRRIIDDLRPSALDDHDLLGVVRDRAERVTSATGLPVELDLPPVLPELPSEVETAAYRIVDEALTNVVRHARARHCVVLVAVDDVLRVSVSDDGVGVNGGRDGGVGLASMRHRAERIGGSFSLQDKDPGTEVVVELPLAAGPR